MGLVLSAKVSSNSNLNSGCIVFWPFFYKTIVMTAIFMVWNNSGFALAADESLSITDRDEQGNERTLWTDTVEKIFSPQNHKICVASAGIGNLNSIPIDAVLTRWAEQLDKKLPKVEDYVIDFLSFIENTRVPNSWHYQHDLRIRIEQILFTFKEEFDRHPSNIIPFVRDMLEKWRSNEPVNVYGDEFNEYIEQNRTEEDDEWKLWIGLAEKWSKHKKVSMKEGDFGTIKLLIQDTLETCFSEVFEGALDLEIEWHKYISDLLIPYLVNTCDGERVANLLFVGYGTEDWTPTSVKINLRNFDKTNPRATLVTVTKPRFVWYLDLAQSGQVEMFLRGIDRSYKDRVIDIFGELADDAGPSIDKIHQFESDRLTKMRAKVDNLSISKMEFVARSFVEMESLGSFLVEFLPSVGGNIRTISMTR